MILKLEETEFCKTWDHSMHFRGIFSG